MEENIWKRFWSKVNVRTPDRCWEWQANLGKGYGMFWFGKFGMVAHRISWMMLRGPIPKGKLVLHKCDNRKCVNPSHLFIGTYSDNVQDMIQKGRQGDYRTGNTKKFNLDDINKVNSMYRAGISLRRIAIEYSTTHQTIKRAMTDGRIK